MRSLCYVLMLNMLMVAAAESTTLIVDPTGNGDFLTLDEAMSAAATRDTLLLTTGLHRVDGIVHDARSAAASMVILGQGEPEETVVQGGTTVLHLRWTTPEMVIGNLTIRSGSPVGDSEKGIQLDYGSLELHDCIVDGTFSFGGLTMANAGSVMIRRCTFDLPGCSAINGGTSYLEVSDSTIDALWEAVSTYDAVGLITNSSISGARGIDVQGNFAIEECRVHDCTFSAIRVSNSTLVGCVIDGNVSSQQSAVVELGEGSSMFNCTVVLNDDQNNTDVNAAIIEVPTGATAVVFENNIVAFNADVGLRTMQAQFTESCNVLWQNANYDYLGITELAPTTRIADPMFCDIGSGDYTIDANSPAAPDNSDPGCGLIGALAVGCGEPVGLPAIAVAPLSLQAHPNPFNPITTLSFDLRASSGPIDLRVFDLGGRLIRALYQGDEARTIVWDGRDETGMTVASGVYFARLAGERGSVVEKIVLTR